MLISPLPNTYDKNIEFNELYSPGTVFNVDKEADESDSSDETRVVFWLRLTPTSCIDIQRRELIHFKELS